MQDTGKRKKPGVKTEPSEKPKDKRVKPAHGGASEWVNAEWSARTGDGGRRSVEEALRDCEELFLATFNQAGVGIGHVTPDGRWVRMNAKLCEILGFSEEEIRSLTIGEITHPEDLQPSMKHFRMLVKGETGSYSLEKRYIRKDGSTVWANLTVSMIHDDSGSPKFAVAVIEDITARKHAEDLLRLSEARYRALYRDNPMMIFTVDTDFNILSSNPFCAEQLGYSTAELDGRSAPGVFHEDDRRAVEEQLRRCLESPGQVYRWQFRKVRKDGRLLWVEEIAQAVYDLSGNLNILIVCQDVTERRRAEEEVGILTGKLEARAAELEAANKELESFNYTVAHDLRKPLTVMNILCQTIEELCGDELSDECMGYVKESYNCTLRMNEIIDSLLNFSRLSHVEPHRQKVDISSLAQVAAAELKISAPDRRFTFRIEEGLTVVGDPQLLQLVLDNLFGNASKFTAGREEPVIEFGTADIGGVTAYFVRDNGCGFDMADAARIFTPFQRLQGDRESTGLGIGLASVERIIRRHGGRVWAEGKKGKGARIYFTVPEEGNGRI